MSGITASKGNVSAINTKSSSASPVNKTGSKESTPTTPEGSHYGFGYCNGDDSSFFKLTPTTKDRENAVTTPVSLTPTVSTSEKGADYSGPQWQN